MANPLSSISTKYRVRDKGRHLWANCAWDSLGIAAMFDKDVIIEAEEPLSGNKLRYVTYNNRVYGPNYVVHFSVPAAQWYDNLIFT